jgi:hypothetical protein
MRNEAVLYRIEVHVIHVGAVIPVITNRVFPASVGWVSAALPIVSDSH